MADRPQKCPICQSKLVKRLTRSKWIQVCEQAYLDGMWDVERAEAKGAAVHRDLGRVISIVPADPAETRFARCYFCSKCKLVTIRTIDVIPPNEVPNVAK